MEKMLDGKTAFITGCNRGIGRSIVEEYAKNGANIYAHMRIENNDVISEFKEVANKYEVNITTVFFDVTDEVCMKNCIKEIIKSKTKIDILVNNAGVMYNSLFLMSSSTQLREQFEINFFAPFLLTQYISKIMVKNKSGSIVNISSIDALDSNIGKSVYGSSKSAIISMSKVISKELGDMGIRCNCIAPGATETDMLNILSNQVISETIESTSLKKVGKPIDIANMAVFLGSDLSNYVTGQVIRVDGGI